MNKYSNSQVGISRMQILDGILVASQLMFKVFIGLILFVNSL